MLLWYPAIAASKLIGIGFGLAALLMLFLAVRNRAGSKDALAMCALMIALLSIEQHYWFWNRPDSILIAIVALGALLFDRARPAVGLAGLGLLAGVAINLKIFGALYLLPLALACLPLVPSWSGLIGAVAIGGGLFVAALALPFEVGSFSLQNYIANTVMVTHQGGIAVLRPGHSGAAAADMARVRGWPRRARDGHRLGHLHGLRRGGLGQAGRRSALHDAAHSLGPLSRGQAVLPGGRCAAERDNKNPPSGPMRGADWRGSDLGLQLVPDGEADSSLSHGVDEARRAALAFRGLP